MPPGLQVEGPRFEFEPPDAEPFGPVEGAEDADLGTGNAAAPLSNASQLFRVVGTISGLFLNC